MPNWPGSRRDPQIFNRILGTLGRFQRGLRKLKSVWQGSSNPVGTYFSPWEKNTSWELTLMLKSWDHLGGSRVFLSRSKGLSRIWRGTDHGAFEEDCFPHIIFALMLLWLNSTCIVIFKTSKNIIFPLQITVTFLSTSIILCPNLPLTAGGRGQTRGGRRGDEAPPLTLQPP